MLTWLRGKKADAGTATPSNKQRFILTDLDAVNDDDRVRLGIELDLPATVLDHYLELLSIRQISADGLDATLRDLTEQFHTLSHELDNLDSMEPVVAAMLVDARAALTNAAFDRVESLLNQNRAASIKENMSALKRNGLEQAVEWLITYLGQ